MARTKTPYEQMAESWCSHGAGFSVQHVKKHKKHYMIFTYVGKNISRDFPVLLHTSFHTSGHSLKNWEGKARKWAEQVQALAEQAA